MFSTIKYHIHFSEHSPLILHTSLYNGKLKCMVSSAEVMLTADCLFWLVFTYSYNPITTECHVPHDTVTDRATPLQLYGLEQTDFTSYFMKGRTIPSFTYSHSGVDYLYWLGSADDRLQNVDILGISTVAECYDMCHLTTLGNCWGFRLER